MAAWALWGAFLLGVRYAVERRRQRQAAAYAVAFLEGEEPTGLESAR